MTTAAPSVLVDSSVWIAASRPQNPACLALRRLIQRREPIAICTIIQVEVCQGARSDEDFHRLWNGMLGFNRLEVQEQHWGKSAWNYAKCRRKGLTVSTLDCLIATLASDYKIPLWTLDQHFFKIAPILGFELFEPTDSA